MAEVDMLAMRYRRTQEREDRRAALAAWVQVEMNRDREKRAEPFTLEEIVRWLGHGFQQEQTLKPEPEPQPSPDDLMQRAHAFMELIGAKKTNGVIAGESHPDVVP